MNEMLAFGWILPVTFIPGIAILIMSTINKRSHVHQSLTSYSLMDEEQSNQIIGIQESRLKIIHRVLTFLYLGVALFSLASFIGGLTMSEMEISQISMMLLLCTAILFITIAAIMLIYESHLATKSILAEGELRQKNWRKSLS